MAVKIFDYRDIDIHAGFRMVCLIDSQDDKTMLQNIFVDLCCRSLDIHDLLFGYDDENNPVETMDYPINKEFAMVYNAVDGAVMVAEV